LNKAIKEIIGEQKKNRGKTKRSRSGEICGTKKRKKKFPVGVLPALAVRRAKRIHSGGAMEKKEKGLVSPEKKIRSNSGRGLGVGNKGDLDKKRCWTYVKCWSTPGWGIL